MGHPISIFSDLIMSVSGRVLLCINLKLYETPLLLMHSRSSGNTITLLLIGLVLYSLAEEGVRQL